MDGLPFVLLRFYLSRLPPPEFIHRAESHRFTDAAGIQEVGLLLRRQVGNLVWRPAIQFRQPAVDV